MVLVTKVGVGMSIHINKCVKHEPSLVVLSNMLELVWFIGNDSIYSSQVCFHQGHSC